MIKKGIIFLAVCVFLILIAGCETIRGAFKGACEGAKKDWTAFKNVDAWMREHLW
jgi:predicted small secreted protein